MLLLYTIGMMKSELQVATIAEKIVKFREKGHKRIVDAK
jgi:hypothetical protein